ncbi:hypothetical protein GMLC_33640 [Geomonas limicola]|uniref:Uncharacterized protein n=1 Tax=Geomonas limicola TaxID=2740186 RepID=A0A6V8NAZ2_9BACT|nr:hypothetical protein [Geomonas limicola]GFO69785.1 hypothetical protein GMLC_33640 [Geomonas limicola]
MIMHPGVLALITGSLLTSAMILYAGWYGVRILRNWDLSSGSELQLALEKRTYLISTLLSYALGFELVSLFLFVFTADRLHLLFSGAMCAAGTLNANGFGYPLLILKLVNFLFAGIWLIVNHADNQGYDYPLIRFKYLLLVPLVPWSLLEFSYLFAYFSGLHADVITSCCGSLFSLERPGIAGDLVSLPVKPMRLAFFGTLGATLASGLFSWRSGKGFYPFSILSLATLLVSLASLVSFLCLYIYQLPSHHCPFCILQGEYHYLGYPIYATLLGGGLAGMGTGFLHPWRRRGSLQLVIPKLQRRLAGVAISLFALFLVIAAYQMVFSPFRLGE